MMEMIKAPDGHTYTGKQELIEGAELYENDAAYLFKQVERYLAKGQEWVAGEVKSAALHSQRRAAELRALV